MVTELKTVHSFWTPVRTLEKLQSTVNELRKEKGIKISTNQLAIKLIDAGLSNEQTLMNVVAVTREQNGVKGARGHQPRPNNTSTSSEAQHEKPAPFLISGDSSLGS